MMIGSSHKTHFSLMFNIPQSLILVLALFLASALLIFFIVHKYLAFLAIDDTGHSAIFSFAIGTIFGLTLAFITVSTFNDFVMVLL